MKVVISHHYDKPYSIRLYPETDDERDALVSASVANCWNEQDRPSYPYAFVDDGREDLDTKDNKGLCLLIPCQQEEFD